MQYTVECSGLLDKNFPFAFQSFLSAVNSRRVIAELSRDLFLGLREFLDFLLEHSALYGQDLRKPCTRVRTLMEHTLP